jgi:hypothetical protein
MGTGADAARGGPVTVVVVVETVVAGSESLLVEYKAAVAAAPAAAPPTAIIANVTFDMVIDVGSGCGAVSRWRCTQSLLWIAKQSHGT